MTGNCGLPDGVVHMHVEACYQAGQRDALTERTTDSAQRALALVRAGLDALVSEAEGKYIVPGVDVTRRARTLAALCDVSTPPGQTT